MPWHAFAKRHLNLKKEGQDRSNDEACAAQNQYYNSNSSQSIKGEHRNQASRTHDPPSR